jgi:hypothetical protein
MDPNLMRTACLEAAFDECVVTEVFHDAHMRHRALARTGFQRGAATSVAAVTDQVRLDASRFRPAANHGKVSPLDGMGTELFAEVSFRFPGVGEDYQAARLLIQPVHGTNRSPPLPQQTGQPIG